MTLGLALSAFLAARSTYMLRIRKRLGDGNFTWQGSYKSNTPSWPSAEAVASVEVRELGREISAAPWACRCDLDDFGQCSLPEP